MKNQDLKALGTANDHTVKLALSYLRALKSPLAESLAGGDFRAVVTAPFPDVTSNDFPVLYKARELLRKYPFVISGVDREKASYANFASAEQACGLQNSWLANLQADPHRAPLFLRRMRDKIREILGPFHWELVAVHSGHGKGATYSLPRACGDAYYKFGIYPDCTSTALPVVDALLRWGFPSWHQALTDGLPISECVTLVAGNRVTTVPKDALKDRLIAIEPSLNMFFQKGLGSLIRSRLKALGLNLNHQQPLNGELARLGSIDGSLATIDLSSASDSVSLGLVEYILPPDWFEAVSLLRSEHGVLPSGELITYEKVASMGCGFTFELESLIFLALALVTVREPRLNVNVAVYGDDIIVPNRDASAVLMNLDCLGFTPNMSKTFSTGPFRESCGKHYLNGEDVTPLYVKEPIDTVPRLYWFANQLKRLNRLTYGIDKTFKDTWDLAVQCIPRACRNRFLIPDGVGDLGLVVDFDAACSVTKFCRTTFSLRYCSFGIHSVTDRVNDNAALLKSLYLLESTPGSLPVYAKKVVEPLEYVPGLKQTEECYVRVLAYTPRWSHHGPWI